MAIDANKKELDEKYHSILDTIRQARRLLASAEIVLLDNESPYVLLTKVIRRANQARTDWHTVKSQEESTS